MLLGANLLLLLLLLLLCIRRAVFGFTLGHWAIYSQVLDQPSSASYKFYLMELDFSQINIAWLIPQT